MIERGRGGEEGQSLRSIRILKPPESELASWEPKSRIHLQSSLVQFEYEIVSELSSVLVAFDSVCDTGALCVTYELFLCGLFHTEDSIVADYTLLLDCGSPTIL